MLFVKVKNNQPVAFPYTIDQLRRDNPQTSFPKYPNNELLSLYEVYPVVEHEISDLAVLTQTFEYTMPELRDGQWHQTWLIRQIAEPQAAENIRRERDHLLQACDWTQVADAPVDRAAWAEYRTQLRDIPNQPGFPYQVAWPFAPNS